VVATLLCTDNTNGNYGTESCFPQENFDASTGGYTCGQLANPTYDDVFFLLSGLTGDRATCTLELIERYKDDHGNVVSTSLVSMMVEVLSCS